jgi:hypothetical protein
MEKYLSYMDGLLEENFIWSDGVLSFPASLGACPLGSHDESSGES